MPDNKTPKGGGEGQPEALSQRTKRGFVWSQIGGMLDYGLYLAFSVLIARAIGVQGFGLYGTVVSYASLGLILTILGMERATHVYAAPLALNEPAKMIYLVRRFLAVRASMGVVVAAVFLVSAGPAMSYLGQPEVGALLGWMGPYIISMGLTGLFMAYFSAKLELRNSRLMKALMQLLNVGGAFWIYQRGGSVGVVLALLSVTSVLTMLTLGWMTRNVISGRAEKVDLAPVYSFCKSQTVTEITAFITGKNADILLLNLLLAGTLQVGYYNVSAALVLAISTMFVVGTGDVALTATSIMVQRREPAQLVLAWRFRIKCSVLLTVPFMVFAFGIAPIIVATLLDRSYLPAVDVFRVAVAGQILISLIGGGAHPDILIASDRHETVRNLRLVMGVVNVVLNLILIPRWGAAGAAAATAISSFGRAFWEFLALGRIHTFVLPGRVMISMFAASVAATLAVAWLPLTRWAFLFTATLGFSAVFLLLAWILKPFDAEDAPILKRAGYPVSELARFVCRAS